MLQNQSEQTPIDMKGLRERLGWSQDEMADYLACDRTSISNYERGVTPVPPLRARLLAELDGKSASVPS